MTLHQIVESSRSLLEERSRSLVDDKGAGAILDVTPGTLGVWRSTGRYNLPFIKVGRNVRYRVADLEAWLEKRRRDSGATA
ncbi:MAG: helix-turn-helix domain-containing protein [Burkholderiaceae bacterium]|nr:helix-turn-helix domain-containing protein [Burkholderiaceae bacterium]